MSDDLGRRRRFTPSDAQRPSGGGNGWLITIVAAIVVVVAGWFLGMALARFAGGTKKQTTVAQITPVPAATPTAQPTEPASPVATASPRATPKPRPSATARATPVASPVSSPTPLATLTPAPLPTLRATPRPVPTRTPLRRTLPVARRPVNTPTPPPVVTPQSDPATVVRAYIEDMRLGDPQAAAAYLGNGSPDESFIVPQTRILTVNTAREADGSYVVAVEMQTPSGKYLETFNVASTPDGNRILEKSVTKE